MFKTGYRTTCFWKMLLLQGKSPLNPIEVISYNHQAKMFKISYLTKCDFKYAPQLQGHPLTHIEVNNTY